MNHSIKPEQDYHYSEVRDLAWVMGSPGLLSSLNNNLDANRVDDGWCLACLRDHADTLQRLDQNPAPLQAWLAGQRQQRLGVYFEGLLGFWLKEILGAEIYHHNVPVFVDNTQGQGRQTVGEFDFLFRLPGDVRPWHWEAAVKFYLRYDNSIENKDEQPRWYGPAARDRLDIKLEHLFRHQLNLSHIPAGRAVIESLGLAAPQPAAFVKGYLFHPYAQWQAAYEEADLSAQHLRGWWLRLAAFRSLTNDCRSRWTILDRRQWLSPARLGPQQAERILTSAAMLAFCEQHFDRQIKPLLLIELQQRGENWYEQSRGFVVSEQWPQLPGRE